MPKTNPLFDGPELELNTDNVLASSWFYVSRYLGGKTDDEILQNLIRALNPDENAGYLIIPPVTAVTDLREHEARLTKRLDHALQTIKRRGFYAESYEYLYKLAKKSGEMQLLAILDLFRCHVKRIPDLTVTEEDWKAAIEMVMLVHEPSTFSSADLFSVKVRYHIPEIWLTALMYNHISQAHILFKDYFQRIDTLEALAAPIGGIDSLIKILQQYLLDDTRDKDEQIEKIRQAAANDSKKLQKELSNAQKALPPMQRRAEQAEKKTEKLERELETAKSQIRELQRQVRIAQLASPQSEPEQSETLDELPETGVLFVGGHPNMTWKLAQKYPAWRFIDADDGSFGTLGSPDVIFFWDKHLSHKTWEKVLLYNTANIPVCYIKATNIEKLELEMRRIYTRVRAANRELDEDDNPSP